MPDQTSKHEAAHPRDAKPAPGQPTTERVQGIFSNIAARYDLLNTLTSLGMHRVWRRSAVRFAEVKPDDQVLDLCAGTGDLALAIARYGRPKSVLGTDFVPEMLEVAEHKLADYHGSTKLCFQQADAQALPLGDQSFDLVTVGFGVRNLPDRSANFREVLRVLKPGGRYVILEFTQPPSRFFKTLYRLYNRNVLPTLGALIAGDRASYQYLNDSIEKFPAAPALAAELKAAGFSSVTWKLMTFGVVAVHKAVK